MAIKRKYTKDQLRNHFERWLAISERFYSIHIDKIVKKYPHLSVSKITNVAYGRAFDFEYLEAIEDVVKSERAALLKRHNLVETL